MKNLDHKDFSLRKEAMIQVQERIIFHSFPQKQPTILRVSQGKNNTAADNVASLLIFHCILDYQLKDTQLNLDWPNDDESCNKICTGKITSCKMRWRSCVAFVLVNKKLQVLQFCIYDFTTAIKQKKIDRTIHESGS